MDNQAYSPVPNVNRWMHGYNVYEKIQMTGFTIQETIISGLYLWETRKILRPGQIFQKKKTRQVMYHLIWVNVLIILLDIALLSTEYADLFTIQTVFKAAVYSIKLRFEFVVLNQLMDLVHRHSTEDYHSGTYKSYIAPGQGSSRTARSIGLDVVSASGQHQRGRSDSRNRNDNIHNRVSTTPLTIHDTPFMTVNHSNSASNMDNHNINHDIKPANTTYSAFATKGGLPHNDSPDVIDGVLRTTEVHVVHGDQKSRGFEQAVEPGMHRPPDDLHISVGHHGDGRLETVTVPERLGEGRVLDVSIGSTVAGGFEGMERNGKGEKDGGSTEGSEVEFAGKGA